MAARYDVEVVDYDPRHATIHEEGRLVRLHFLEDCLYVLSQEA